MFGFELPLIASRKSCHDAEDTEICVHTTSEVLHACCRRACLRYLLLPILRYSPQSFQQAVLKDRAKVLLDIISDKSGTARYTSCCCEACLDICPTFRIQSHFCVNVEYLDSCKP